MLFAYLKRILALDRLRLRGPNGARDEFTLVATAQNLRKMAKLIPMQTLEPAQRPVQPFGPIGTGANTSETPSCGGSCRDERGKNHEPGSGSQLSIGVDTVPAIKERTTTPPGCGSSHRSFWEP